MSNKIEGVPEGWELVGIRTVNLNHLGKVVECDVEHLLNKDYVIVRKIEPPKPTYIPWTFETCPLGVHVECLDARKKGMVTGAGDDGARIGATVYSFVKKGHGVESPRFNPLV